MKFEFIIYFKSWKVVKSNGGWILNNKNNSNIFIDDTFNQLLTREVVFGKFQELVLFLVFT